MTRPAPVPAPAGDRTTVRLTWRCYRDYTNRLAIYGYLSLGYEPWFTFEFSRGMWESTQARLSLGPFRLTAEWRQRR